jgi:putative ABC transport system substrate-binding protein
MAARARRPAVYPARGYVEAGGLMSWGPNPEACFARAAVYVDKILKGAKAGDLPVEQATRIELVANREAFRAMGLQIPPEIQRQAILVGR